MYYVYTESSVKKKVWTFILFEFRVRNAYMCYGCDKKDFFEKRHTLQNYGKSLKMI